MRWLIFRILKELRLEGTWGGSKRNLWVPEITGNTFPVPTESWNGLGLKAPQRYLNPWAGTYSSSPGCSVYKGDVTLVLLCVPSYTCKQVFDLTLSFACERHESKFLLRCFFFF